jgi:hypothetical protein
MRSTGWMSRNTDLCSFVESIDVLHILGHTEGVVLVCRVDVREGLLRLHTEPGQAQHRDEWAARTSGRPGSQLHTPHIEYKHSG